MWIDSPPGLLSHIQKGSVVGDWGGGGWKVCPYLVSDRDLLGRHLDQATVEVALAGRLQDLQGALG